MIRFFLAMALVVPAAAAAQQLSGKASSAILESGKVVSSVSISGPAQTKALQGPIPEGARTHEVFIQHDGNTFICYLVGSPKSGVAPYASCFGRDIAK